jgi:flagellar biosynthetic protein FliR
MTLSWTLLQPYLLAFGLVLVRLSTAFFFVPVLGGTAIPLPSRISVAVVFSVLLTPLAMAQGPQTPEIVAVVLAAFGEFLVGLGIGLVVRLVLLIGEIAGAIVDLQMGFAFSMIADPLTRETTPVTARLMGVVTTLLFLLLDGHHYVIAGLGASLQHAPIGSGLARLSKSARATPPVVDDHAHRPPDRGARDGRAAALQRFARVARTGRPAAEPCSSSASG